MTEAGRVTRIALIGDYRPDVTAHICAPRAIALAAHEIGKPVSPCWVETSWLGRAGVESVLAGYDAIWCVPASPYYDQGAVLDAIRVARTSGLPFLGTCGGFQSAVIEFARNVLGVHDANSVEDDPETSSPVVNQLSCALREVASGIRLTPNSEIAKAYGTLNINESYNCGYGFNPDFESLFKDSAMAICGYDNEGPKAIELEDHDFFIGTAFQPERSALEDSVHPLIRSFVEAASA